MTAARRLLAAVLAGVAIGWPASARSVPAATGFQSTGTLVLQATYAGNPFNIGGDIALYRRGSLYRLDLLSLNLPLAGATAGAVAGALLAPGGATLIYDGSTGAVSAYANANHAYYQGTPAAVSSGGAAPAAAPAASPSNGAADPLATLASIARQLHDVERAYIQLTGHSVTNGHPTDDLDLVVRRRRPGKPLEDYHAQVYLADDLDGFPVRILFASTPATPNDFGGKLRLDLTSITPQTPDDDVFALPAGYRRVNSIGEILQPPH